MKKLLIILSMVSLLWACSDDDVTGPSGEISLDKPSLLFERTGGELEVTVTSGGDWRLSGKKTWCHPSAVQGKSGDKVLFAVDENQEEDTRKITYTFICGSQTVDLEVTQAKEIILEPVRDEEIIGPKGGIVTVRVQTNSAMEIKIPEAVKEWVTPVDAPAAARGTENVYLQFNVAENTTFEDRDAEIALCADGETVPVTIKQAKNLSITVTPASAEIPEAGGEITLDVTANMGFEVSMSALTQTFVTKTGETSRVEGHLTITTITFSVEGNDVMTRNAEISFKSAEGDLTRKVTLNQIGTTTVITTIPDAALRTKLVQNKFIKDGSVENCELTWKGFSATSMNIGYTNIVSLEGIEAFIGLEKLDVSSCKLEKINMSKNINLKTLTCTLNGLKELILGDTRVETINLEDGLYHNGANYWDYITPTSFIVSGAHLKSLNISMQSWYSACDTLQTLDVSGCPALETLNCVRTDEKLKTLILAEGQTITTLQKSDFTTIVRK